MKRSFYYALMVTICVLTHPGHNARIDAETDFHKGSISNGTGENLLPHEKVDDGACFTADTLVMMADGSSKKIIDIKVGDKVKSFRLETGKLMNTEVIKTKNGFAGHHYVINGGLKVTPPHPFCTPDNKWVKIRDLKAGQIVRISSSVRKIASIEHKIEGQRIYNIYVKDNHNFFVSGDGKDFFLVKEWK